MLSRFRKLTWPLVAWSILVISLPRLYLGLHYPSDILGGAVLGIGVVLAGSGTSHYLPMLLAHV